MAEKTIPLSLRIPAKMKSEIWELQKEASARAGYQVTRSAVILRLLRQALNREKANAARRAKR